MRILVVGGTGFIGRHVVERLTGMGHEVVLFHRGLTEAGVPNGVRHIVGDRTNLPSYKTEFDALGPDVVLDTVAYSEKDAREVMGVFGGIAGRIVALSSMDVYRAYGRIRGDEPGPPDPVPLTEDAPLREKFYPYRGMVEGMEDYEKILVERAVMGSPDLPGTVLRLPMVYGPADRQHRLFPYLKRMDDERTAILLHQGFARLRATRGYVENIAAAIALTVTSKRAAGRVYNVGEVEAMPEAEWVQLIGKAAGWKGNVLEVSQELLPDHLKMRMKFPANQDWVVDTTRIRRELGYREAVPRNEALRRTVAWERANPPDNIDPEDFDYEAEDAALAGLA